MVDPDPDPQLCRGSGRGLWGTNQKRERERERERERQRERERKRERERENRTEQNLIFACFPWFYIYNVNKHDIFFQNVHPNTPWSVWIHTWNRYMDKFVLQINHIGQTEWKVYKWYGMVYIFDFVYYMTFPDIYYEKTVQRWDQHQTKYQTELHSRRDNKKCSLLFVDDSM